MTASRPYVVFIAFISTLACTGVLVAGLVAQTAVASVALVGARLIDGTGRPAVENATVVIEGGRIAAAGPAASVRVPSNATRVDVSGKTIVPGLINAHGHLNAQASPTRSVRDDLLRRLHTYAMYGVTTVVSLGSNEADEMETLTLREQQRTGALDIPRIFTSGQIVADMTPEAARRSVARLAGLKADFVKFRLNGVPRDIPGDAWRALVAEARARRIPTAAHIVYLRDAKAVVAEGGNVIAHSVRDQDVDAELMAAMKARGVSYIPTLTRDLSVYVYESTPAFFSDPFFLRGRALYEEDMKAVTAPATQAQVRGDAQAQDAKRALAQAKRNLKLLSDAGVTIALGTDTGAGGSPGRWQGYFEQLELEMMVEAGLTPMQAVVAASGGAAKAMGLQGIGTLEAGAAADLLVLGKDPLADIRNTRTIEALYIAGRKLTF